MKIALVAQHPSPAVPALAHGLTGKGHHVTMCGQGTGLDDTELLARAGGFAGSLRDRWTRDRPDVVHAACWTGGLAALAAARDMDVPVIQSFGSLAVAERRCRLIPDDTAARRGRLEAAIGRGARAVIAASSGTRADLASLGVPRTSVTVIPCGVDTAEFRPDGPVARRGALARLVTVTGAHGLDAYDELAVLLRALPRVPGAELLVIGGPPREELDDHPAHRKLMSLAVALGVADRVAFAGQASRRALPALLRSADLLVAASESDPAGTAALQAMASGVPVVALASGGPVADAVVDGTTGILVDPGRPELLPERIRDLLAHRMLRSAFSIAGIDRVQSRYSWDRITDEIIAVYDGAAHAVPLAA